MPAKTVDRYGAGPGTTMTPHVVPKDDWFVVHDAIFEKRLKPEEKVWVYWDYKSIKESMIEEIVTHCGCTANVKHGTKGISAEFTHQQQEVPEGGKQYTKYLTVYLKDGKKKEPDGRGAEFWPADKALRTLSITGWLLP